MTTRFLRSVLINISGVVGFLILWTAVAWIKHDKLFLVSPIDVAREFGKSAQTSAYWHDWSVSMTEYGLGLLLATIVGIGLGVVLGLVPSLRKAFDPLLAAGTATPSVALAPLFILWFGTGLSAKVAIVWFVAWWPIIVGTLTGIANVDPAHREVARAFRASRSRTILTVLIPAALPAVVGGLRVGAGVGLVGVIIGEFFGSNAGLGFEILNATNSFNLSKLLLGVISLAVVGILITSLLRAVENRLN
jgi:NitT/TauT family transport system permease protein